MKDKDLKILISEFVDGLLKKAKCNHAGNCYAMYQILKPYLSCFFGIETLINTAKVRQGNRKVDHYYLLRMKDGMIIDATSSQFRKPNGEKMERIYIGKMPKWYLSSY